jgi:hypothetical protein
MPRLRSRATWMTGTARSPLLLGGSDVRSGQERNPAAFALTNNCKDVRYRYPPLDRCPYRMKTAFAEHRCRSGLSTRSALARTNPPVVLTGCVPSRGRTVSSAFLPPVCRPSSRLRTKPFSLGSWRGSDLGGPRRGALAGVRSDRAAARGVWALGIGP